MVAMTSRKKVSSSHIPYDLALCILSKLPLKPLKRFTCVQKSWSLLFQNSQFMNMFHTDFFKSKTNEDSQNTSLLIHFTNFVKGKIPIDELLSKLSSNRFEDMVIIDWPPPFKEDHIYMEMLGSSSVNGIICLYQDYGHESPIVLWNPATTEFKVLPPSFQVYNENIEFNPPPSAFGYDCVTDDYKVLRNVFLPEDSPYEFSKGPWLFLPEKDSPFWELLMNDDDMFWLEVESKYIYADPFWEIYSLKNNNWRKLNDIDMPLVSGSRVNSNELCHFLGFEDKMFSFDFSNEKFILTVLPSDSNFEFHNNCKHLLIVNESVVFAYDDCKNNYHIWILGKLGVKESWTKLLNIGHVNDLGYPIGAWKNHIFFSHGHKIVRYNLSTQKFEKFEIYVWKVISYKEVLRSIEGMKN
ncbi:putative F-box protein At5g15660 [Vicia villosa]|uniref:putative F-box protein At5g15660 n=1 Tax=Vicia villosa TaxID=3911 RepID=UPI00273C28CA|nr:putative F-box protein At5g15660 [Vicia villosa]